MPKSKIQKQEILRDLLEKFKKSKSVIFTGFNALGVKDNEILRNQLRKEEGEYYVTKKTLMNLALKENKIDLNARNFEGKMAAIFSYKDEVAGARIIGNFRKDKEKTKKIFFLGGILGDKLLSKEETESLSKLPGKDELYAKVVGSLNAPISGLVNVMAGTLRGLVNVLKAIENK